MPSRGPHTDGHPAGHTGRGRATPAAAVLADRLAAALIHHEPADAAVDGLAEQVGVAGGLLQQVEQDLAQREAPASSSGCAESWSRVSAWAAAWRLRSQACRYRSGSCSGSSSALVRNSHSGSAAMSTPIHSIEQALTTVYV
jgi:hypothetical protein